jgi:hypothetical protein
LGKYYKPLILLFLELEEHFFEMKQKLNLFYCTQKNEGPLQFVKEDDGVGKAQDAFWVIISLFCT